MENEVNADVLSFLMDIVDEYGFDDEIDTRDFDIDCGNDAVGESFHDSDEELDYMLEEEMLQHKIKENMAEIGGSGEDDILQIMGIKRENVTDFDYQIQLVEKAMSENRKLKDNLLAFECELIVIQSRTLEEEDKSVQTNNSNTNSNVSNCEDDFYLRFAAPYFKIRNYSCPVNNEYKMKMSAKPRLYENDEVQPYWERNELVQLQEAIRRIFLSDYSTKMEETFANSSESKKVILKHQNFILYSPMNELLELYSDDSLDWDKVSIYLKNPHSGRDCRLIWNLYLKPTINKRFWTDDENLELRKIAKHNNYQDWDKIALCLSTETCSRTGYQVFLHFKRNLTDSAGNDTTRSDLSYFDKMIKLSTIGEQIPWHKIKYHFDYSDWNKLYGMWYRGKCLLPGFQRFGKFTESEDRVIMKAIHKGISMSKLPHILKSRSFSQIWSRYDLQLKSQLKLKYGTWTQEEDELLFHLIEEHGEKWSEIAKAFKTRSRVQIRHRYINLKRALSKDNINPKDADFSKLRRRKNTYTRKNRRAIRLHKSVIKSKNDDLISEGKAVSEESHSNEDVRLLKYFLFDYAVIKGQPHNLLKLFKDNTDNTFSMCSLLSVFLNLRKKNCFHKRNDKTLREYNACAKKFLWCNKDKVDSYNLQYLQNNSGNILFNKNIIEIFPPNILTLNAWKNYSARHYFQKSSVEANSQPLKKERISHDPDVRKAVTKWVQRLFALFSGPVFLQKIKSNEIQELVPHLVHKFES